MHDHKNWPDHDNCALHVLQYGTDEVWQVFHHFEPVLQKANCHLR